MEKPTILDFPILEKTKLNTSTPLRSVRPNVIQGLHVHGTVSLEASIGYTHLTEYDIDQRSMDSYVSLRLPLAFVSQ